MKKNLVYSLLLLILVTTQPLTAQAKDQNFDWSASATLTSNYIWRGLYCGGLSLQADAEVSYCGFFANMWWNVGAGDWTFTTFNPEVDLSIGFSRWGLSVYYMHMYYFDHYADGSMSKFFDFSNHPRGGGGTTGEWRVAYRVSDRVPLSVLVGCRTFGRDGYIDQNGELKRAYSSYIEVGYDVNMRNDWALQLRLGMTPAKSLYTGYQGDFAVHHLGAKLTKTWALGTGEKSPSMTAFAHVMLNPWQLNKDNLILPIAQAGDQKLNCAVGCSVGL